jgi:hypothetical protein
MCANSVGGITPYLAGQRYKIAYAYKSGDWALYINGVQKRTNAEPNVPAVSQFNLSATGLGGSPVTAKNGVQPSPCIQDSPCQTLTSLP